MWSALSISFAVTLWLAIGAAIYRSVPNSRGSALFLGFCLTLAPALFLLGTVYSLFIKR